jgi:hypothetical protein
VGLYCLHCGRWALPRGLQFKGSFLPVLFVLHAVSVLQLLLEAIDDQLRDEELAGKLYRFVLHMLRIRPKHGICYLCYLTLLMFFGKLGNFVCQPISEVMKDNILLQDFDFNSKVLNHVGNISFRPHSSKVLTELLQTGFLKRVLFRETGDDSVYQLFLTLLLRRSTVGEWSWSFSYKRTTLWC